MYQHTNLFLYTICTFVNTYICVKHTSVCTNIMYICECRSLTLNQLNQKRKFNYTYIYQHTDMLLNVIRAFTNIYLYINVYKHHVHVRKQVIDTCILKMCYNNRRRNFSTGLWFPRKKGALQSSLPRIKIRSVASSHVDVFLVLFHDNTLSPRYEVNDRQGRYNSEHWLLDIVVKGFNLGFKSDVVRNDS